MLLHKDSFDSRGIYSIFSRSEKNRKKLFFSTFLGKILFKPLDKCLKIQEEFFILDRKNFCCVSLTWEEVRFFYCLLLDNAPQVLSLWHLLISETIACNTINAQNQNPTTAIFVHVYSLQMRRPIIPQTAQLIWLVGILLVNILGCHCHLGECDMCVAQIAVLHKNKGTLYGQFSCVFILALTTH